jgi:predicted esterase
MVNGKPAVEMTPIAQLEERLDCLVDAVAVVNEVTRALAEAGVFCELRWRNEGHPKVPHLTTIEVKVWRS